MSIMEKDEYIEYTAYIKTENEEGFIHLDYDYDLDKPLLTLVDSIEEAYFYTNSKQNLMSDLAWFGVDYVDLKFYKKKITTIIEISED